jgi:hypothetical protein
MIIIKNKPRIYNSIWKFLRLSFFVSTLISSVTFISGYILFRLMYKFGFISTIYNYFQSF